MFSRSGDCPPSRFLPWTMMFNIHDKVMHWFTVIGRELNDPAIVPENVYNLDETGVLLSVLSSLKVLVSKDDLRNYRGAGVKRTLVTAIDCISADGRSADIWPASTYRSTWNTHPTPGWHFACSKTNMPTRRLVCHGYSMCLTPSRDHERITSRES
jgi:hypothetical protein